MGTLMALCRWSESEVEARVHLCPRLRPTTDLRLLALILPSRQSTTIGIRSARAGTS